MKGIVLEIKNKQAIVMTDDGMVCETRNQEYRIGQEITVTGIKSNITRVLRWGISVAAALMLLVGGNFAYATPMGYVSLDVNPSIEYSINIFDRVIDVKAINEDGATLLTSLDVKNLSIEDAIKRTTDELIAEGYIADDQNGGLVIATFIEDEEKATALAEKLKNSIQTYIDEEGKTAEVVSEAVGQKRVQEAAALGVTAGKLNLVQKMLALSGEEENAALLEEWLGKSVKEINKEAKDLRQDQKDDEEDDLDIDDDDEDDLDIDDDSDVEEEEISDIEDDDDQDEKSENTSNTNSSPEKIKKEKVENGSNGSTSHKTEKSVAETKNYSATEDDDDVTLDEENETADDDEDNDSREKDAEKDDEADKVDND